MIFVAGREFPLVAVTDDDDASILATILDAIAGVNLFAGQVMKQCGFHRCWQVANQLSAVREILQRKKSDPGGDGKTPAGTRISNTRHG
jgi:hypothetical protein